ncbi:MAG TPA: hypothetical protein VL362_01060 [Patescibacteria group bacterium]|nr:hypothetical protein [Patescibacteria group bacterium]
MLIPILLGVGVVGLLVLTALLGTLGLVLVFIAATVAFAYYRFYQWATLSAVAALWIILCYTVDVPAGWVVFFWIIWLACLVATIIWEFALGMVAAVMAVIAGLLIMIFAGSVSWSHDTAAPAPSQPPKPSVTVTNGAGQSQQVPLVTNTDETTDTPAAGEQTSDDAATRPTLDCQLPLQSLSELVTCVNGSDKKDEFITYYNAHKGALGASWSDVVNLAKKEVETRVIVIANSNISDQEARQLLVDKKVVKDMKEAKSLPIVRVDGALVNTTSGATGSGSITPFADSRSQVRVLLVAREGTQKQIEEAKKGHGTLAECSNLATGIVVVPKTVTRTVTTTQPPVTVTSPPVTVTTTQPPTTTTTTPTPTTTTTTPTPTTTTTTPTPTTTTTETCPPWENGHVPTPDSNGNCEKDPGVIPSPTATHTPVPSPSGSPETTQPTETHTADPTVTPGAPEPSITAPGATATETTDDPPATVDPSPSVTATGDVDPDSNSSTQTSQARTTSTATSSASSTGNGAPAGDAESEPTGSNTANKMGGLFGAPLLLLAPLLNRKDRRKRTTGQYR